ncbi:dual specificity protein phosphatase 23 [Lingula anatina]|uniref:Dual specificity protein phosphatase 23 n=1 Tax=Lingula anatina TaxID=7574 RepID=A0A1S3IP51_LINAN|nr:dual specificity protein phosphatase 23 [Lingula anatina]|eukprot:XP_013399319.1 dual specificity protein phosphatase 23 [Lingula anatina]
MASKKPPNFSWVIDNVLAGCGFPSSPAHIQYMKDNGVKHLISLTAERTPPTQGFTGFRLIQIKLKDFTSPTVYQVDDFIRFVDEARQKGEGVAVHCMLGRGRTGTMLACYLAREHGLTGQQAIEETRRLRPHSIETVEQEELIKTYVEHLKKQSK